MAELVAEGKIRALGVSNYAAWQIARMNHVADAVGAPRPVVAQQLYNLLARRIEEEYLEFAARHRTAHDGLQPARRRVCSPAGTPSTHGPADRAASATPGWRTMYKERYWNTAIFRGRRASCRVIADKAGIPLTDLALRWLLGRDDGGRDPARRIEGRRTCSRQHRRRREAGTARRRTCRRVRRRRRALRGPMPTYNR